MHANACDDARRMIVEARPDVVDVVSPPEYPWADPTYGVVHALIVACHRTILADRSGGARSGVRGVENLRTLTLVEEAYARAANA